MSRRAFARGVKLLTQHVYDPAVEMAGEMGAAELHAQESRARTRIHWTVPALTGRTFETQANRLYLPFLVPEFQQDFDLATKRVVSTGRRLESLTVSWDQRAEPYAVTDRYAPGAAEGRISAADMTRLTMWIKLFEKVPTRLGGTQYNRTELWSIEIPGVESFGGRDFRANPLVVDTLGIQLHPWRTYCWEVWVPGLWAAAPDDTLMMPSFTMQAVLASPLVQRDIGDSATPPAIQNIPTVHRGARQTHVVPVTVPAADQLVDGTADLQQTWQDLETVLRNRLRAGYGDSPGMESDVMPTEHLAEDSAVSLIMIPMWQGVEDWRQSETAAKGLAYTTGPGYVNPTCDRRLLVIPEGFVLHHAFAVWSTNAPPCPTTGGNATWASRLTVATTFNRVGLAVNAGIGGDAYRMQQLAYGEWNDLASLAALEVDSFLPDVESATIPSAWTIVELPLVSDAVGTADSFVQSGPPIYLGRSNTTTAPRTPIGNMPALFGGAAYGASGTAGGETFLEARWQIQDAGPGLAGTADEVVVGTGGNWIILMGRQTATQ